MNESSPTPEAWWRDLPLLRIVLQNPMRFANVLAAIVLVAGFGLYLTRSLDTMRHPDFNVYYLGANVERHGGTYTDRETIREEFDKEQVQFDSGAPVPYGSPALVALVFGPLTFLPMKLAFVLYTLASIAVLAWACSRYSNKNWLLVLLWWCLWTASVRGFITANFSIFTGAFLTLAFFDLRSGRDRRAGIWLGITIAAKLYPGLLIIPLAFSRRWSTVAWSLMTSGALALLSLPVLGRDGISSWIKTITLTSDVSSQSLVNTKSIAGYAFYVTDSRTLLVVLSCVLLLAFLYLSYAMRKLDAGESFAIATAAMLLIQPISWDHYFLACLPLVAVITYLYRDKYVSSVLVGIACFIWLAPLHWAGFYVYHLRTSIAAAICLAIVAWGFWRRPGPWDAHPVSNQDRRNP